MGRCGKDINTLNEAEYNDDYHIIFTLHDYVYLYERIFIMMKEKMYIQIHWFQKKNFESLNCTSMLFLKYECWHNCIEVESSNPFTLDSNRQ